MIGIMFFKKNRWYSVSHYQPQIKRRFVWQVWRGVAGKVERREGGCQGKFLCLNFPTLEVVIKISFLCGPHSCRCILALYKLKFYAISKTQGCRTIFMRYGPGTDLSCFKCPIMYPAINFRMFSLVSAVLTPAYKFSMNPFMASSL